MFQLAGSSREERLYKDVISLFLLQDAGCHTDIIDGFPDSKVDRANMGPIWGRQDPGGPHVGPMNFAIWVKPKEMELQHWSYVSFA